MKSYGQYCPIARTSEIFAERWTPIIVRNLLAGCRSFGEIRQGAPGIPKALLTDRLDLLERVGVVTRERAERGRGWTYTLTEKGAGLASVCTAMGEWGARWLEVEPRHLDPAYVLWATCRLVDMDKVPEPGVVVRFDLRSPGARSRLWMHLVHPRAEICTSALGRTEDLVVDTDCQTLVDYNTRRLTWSQAVRAGRLSVEGSTRLVRALPGWIQPSPFAHIEPTEPAAVRREPRRRRAARDGGCPTS